MSRRSLWAPPCSWITHECSIYAFKLRACAHAGVSFPQFELVCTVAILLRSHSRASVKWLELMMLLKCLWAASPVARAVMPSPSVPYCPPLFLTFGEYFVLFYILCVCAWSSGGFSPYLVFLGVLVVLDGVYLDLLFLPLVLSFLLEDKVGWA